MKWNVFVIAGTFICLAMIGLLTIFVDPFFHYHGPTEGLSYELLEENSRYQNDGIARHFAYDALITGSSMTQNFKTSTMDEVFGVQSIKVAYSGARYKEINEALERAFEANPDIKVVVRGLDLAMLVSDKDAVRKDYDYPTYMTNDNVFDDVSYLFNKEILLNHTVETLWYTMSGGETTSFDAYGRLHDDFTFGKEAVLASYVVEEPQRAFVRVLKDEERRMIAQNLEQNVLQLAREHSETTFYLFFPPYSIYYWDEMNSYNEVLFMLEAQECAIEQLLEQPNIRLYSFWDNFDMICNPDNYFDSLHYGEWINDDILRWMYEGEYLLTKDNYQEHMRKLRDFFTTYDYTSLRQ